VKKGPFILSLFVVSASCVVSFYYLDIPVALFCRELSSTVTDVFQVITRFGVSTWYIVISLAAFLFFHYARKNRKYADRALLVCFSVAASGILINLMKVILGRYRPVMLFEKELYGFSFFGFKYAYTSFPSGHATTIAALMTSFWFIFPKYRAVFLTGALLVGASRLVLCSHYLSDTIFGAYLGAVTAVVVRDCMRKKGFEVE